MEILSNATTKKLEKQKGKIKAYTKVGKEIKSDLDFDLLGDISRTEETVNKAFSKLEQNQDKVNYSLFWFLNASPFDNTAFEYLKNGDEEKALEIWEKVTNDKEVNSKNFSAFNNIGTFKLLGQSKSEIQEGIEAKIKLIESDYFQNFVHTVADQTFTIDKYKQSEKLIDELLTQLNKQYSSSETLQLFIGCNDTTQKYVSKKFTEQPLHNIESQIESCKNKRKADKSNAYEFGLRLAKNCKDDLTLLKSLLGTGDLKYKAVADQLANEIMQCGIDYFNESQENNSTEDYLEQAQKLTKIADKIAVGQLTKDRAKDSLATLEEMKDREVNQAIQVLQMIKTMNSKIEYGYSLNWDKITELIKEAIPIKNINKIKNTNDKNKISEYRGLVTYILDYVVGTYHWQDLKYLKYWETEQKTSPTTRTTSTNRPTSNYQSTESEFSFSENAWWILGLAGVVVGLMMGFSGGCIITGFIGLGIGSKFRN